MKVKHNFKVSEKIKPKKKKIDPKHFKVGDEVVFNTLGRSKISYEDLKDKVGKVVGFNYINELLSIRFEGVKNVLVFNYKYFRKIKKNIDTGFNIQNIRPSVIKFAIEMEKELSKHDDIKGANLFDVPTFLSIEGIKRNLDRLIELDRETYFDKDMRKQCVDIANYALILQTSKNE